MINANETIQKCTKLVRAFSLSILLGVAIFLSTKISVPMYPVPMTLQPTALFLISLLFSTHVATLATFHYLLAGLVGLPVFASGYVGLIAFAGPTGGYLVSFLFSTYIMAKLSTNIRSFGGTLLICILGLMVIYTLGALRLAMILGDMQKALTLGVLPFIVKDILSCIIAASLTQWMRKDSLKSI